MNESKLVTAWQEKIAECCTVKLGRALSATERAAIQQYEGFMALEMIEDTVREAQPVDIARYLASIASQTIIAPPV